MRFITGLATLLAWSCGLAPAQTDPIDLLERKLLNRIEAVDTALAGVLGVAVIDLQTGRKIGRNADTVFPQASSIKIPIMIEVFRAARAGTVKLDDTITLEKRDSVEGSGHLRILMRSHPIAVSIRELVTAMIETSDNTAANRLIAMVGMDAVNRSIKDMGFTATKLQRRMLEPDAAKADRENISTPDEMARMAELLYRGKAVDEAASREMIEILKLVSANFRESIPDSVLIASKPGEVNGVRAETGIVFLPGRPFVLSVMATYLERGVNPVPQIARIVYEHFEKLSHSNRHGHNLQ
jgi:beta-lactamase class A